MHNALKIALTFTAIDAAAGVIRGVEKEILGMGKAAKQVQKDFEGMVSNAQAGLKALAASWAILNELKSGIRIATSMEEAIGNLKMTLHTTGKAAGQLTEELSKAREVADSLQKITPFSSEDIVRAEIVLKRGGASWKDIIDPKGAAYAGATLATILVDKGLTPESASAMLMNVAIPFKIKGSQYGELANLMQKALTSTRLGQNPESFATGLANFAGEASQMAHWSPQESIQALATVSEAVRDPSAAGTYLKNFITRIGAPSKKSQMEIEKFGLHFWDKEGEMKPLPALIEEIRHGMKGHTDKEIIAALKSIFEMRGLEAVLAFLRKGMGSWEDEGRKMAETAETSTKLADRLEEFDANMKSLVGTVKSATANAFNPILHYLTEMTKKANDWVDAMGKYAGAHQDTMKKLDLGAVAVGGGVAAYGTYRLLKALYFASKFLKGWAGSSRLSTLGLAEDKILGKAAGVMPVYVTNWAMIAGARRGLGMPGAPVATGGAAEGTAAEAASRVGAGGAATIANAPWLVSLIPGVAILEAEYEAMKAYPLKGEPANDWNAQFREEGNKRDMLMNDWNPEFMQAGADKIAKAVKEVKPEVHNEVNLAVNVTPDRVTVSSDDAKTKINVKRGKFLSDLHKQHY